MLQVSVPQDLLKGIFERESVVPGKLVMLVSEENSYTVHATPFPENDIELLVEGLDNPYRKIIDDDGDEGSEELTDKFRKGRYSVCVIASGINVHCDLGGYNVRGLNFVRLASALISRTRLGSSDESGGKSGQYRVKIKIFRENERPSGLPNGRSHALLPDRSRGPPRGQGP